MMENNLIAMIFTPGSRVILTYIDHHKKAQNDMTRIEELEGNYLVIQSPAVDTVPVVFWESQELTLRRVDSGSDEAYVTNVFVVDIRQGEIPLLVCSKPKQIDKTSLRRFSRFGVELDLQYRKGQFSGYGQICDLSVSGCHVLVDLASPVVAGDSIKLEISIPNEAKVAIEGNVIRLIDTDEKGKKGLAIEYGKVDQATREILYNYIFQLQITADTILDPQQGH